MIHFIRILTVFILFSGILFAQTRVYMKQEGGVYTIPCKVNGLDLRFIFDTGASNVTISLTEALFMLKNGHLKSEDIFGSTYAKLANGEITENTEILLREIKIAGMALYNVRASIVHELGAPLLLGQTAISRLGRIQLNGNELLIFQGGGGTNNSSSTGGSATSNGQWRPGMVHCAVTPTEIVEIRNPITGRVWMDRNLGASRAATSSTDEDAYGDLYQWGRFGDGHQCRNSAVISTLSSRDSPGHGRFIIVVRSDGIFDAMGNDWRSPKNDNLWQGVNGINNPCPAGFRLPIDSEWEAERNSWNNNFSSGAIQYSLKLPLGGYRYYNDGAFGGIGTHGHYLSASVPYRGASYLYFSRGEDFFASLVLGNRGSGFSVRCIKD